ncbi:MAG: hypothetical protein M1837_003888, partial [Sclerophora amabilis]
MPKKGQGSKGGSSKKPVPSSTSNVDDGFIIFSNEADGKAKATGPGNENSQASAKAARNATAGSSEEAQKRADTRSLIGGSSWTGKLPVNLLSEHCQKQKWAKPEYNMYQSKTPEGFSSMVILKSTNPKTKETVILPPFKLPPTHKHLAVQPTAVEARHFAATYALFRVCSMRNIHMMLPPNYRDLWKNEFQELKTPDIKEGRGWMYEADPFVARKEREEAQQAIAKKREQKAKQVTEASDGFHAMSLSASTPSGPSGTGGQSNPAKGWTKAPKIDMGKRTRTQVEELIRKHAVWNVYDSKISSSQAEKIVDEFSHLGFRRSHVQEAVSECKDREECLEWLLIYVPEDDLPQWSLPEGYAAGISMASSDLKREAVIKRLAAAGYSIDLCEKTLAEQSGKEASAAEALQQILANSIPFENVSSETQQSEGTSKLNEAEQDMWELEQSNLEAIFGPRYKALSTDVYQVALEVRGTPHKMRLQLRPPISRRYPLAPPVLSLVSEPHLPAYIRLSIVRKAIHYAQQELLGDQMVFSLIDWLESNVSGIIEGPGKLRDVAAAASSLAKIGQDNGVSSGAGKRKKHVSPVNWRPGTAASLQMLSEWTTRQSTPDQEKMMAARRKLPAWDLKDTIVDTVNSCQVTIISGETGSGKSTQSVQFILDDMIQRKLGGAANMICTQPRRISALGLADRVSDERRGAVGKEIGYAIRGESKQSPGTTRITFVTTGVLLRRLQTSGGSSEDVLAALADISHVFVDEVHERSLDTDFLLVLLRDVLKRRTDLKLILMSATLDADFFENYFNSGGAVGRVEIEGRTYPVQDHYLDDVIRQTGFNIKPRYPTEQDDSLEGQDLSVAKAIQYIGGGVSYDLVAQAVKQIDEELGIQEGGILIFLPGTLEINRTLDAIRAIPNVLALPLHASLLPAEQRRVFPRAPRGMRKVIAATNVAETSITIEDIVAVIDTGRVKETSYDPQNNMVKLEEVWASRAACKQRRGRAGRVREGQCYKLYTRNAELTKMAERPEPEIRRVPLEQLCLSVRAMGIEDVPSFLAKALTPPETMAVDGAMSLLGRIGALDGGKLTALGRHLSMIPADLRCGKLMVYGATFGCLEACLTVASILTVRSPFVSPASKRDESKESRSTFSQGQGDLIADLHAYEEWSNMRQTQCHREIRAWCDQNYLSFQTLTDVSSNRAQYLSSLKEAGFLPFSYTSPSASSSTSSSSSFSSSPNPGPYNTQNTNVPLLRALIAASFNPQLVRIDFPSKKYASSMSGAVELDPEARTIKFFDQDSGRVFVHPSSTLFGAQSFPSDSTYLAYFNKMATSKVFIRELT